MNNYAMTRGWMDHDVFGPKEPFTKREAWIWLIENACWKETRIRIGMTITQLKRGQLSYSVRFLAEKWLWHAAKVQRFISLLKIDSMIDTDSEHGRMIITICNYNKYQLVPNYHEAENDTIVSTAPIQERYSSDTKKNTLNTLNTINTNKPTAQKLFDQFWEVYPRQRRGGRDKALKAYLHAIKTTSEEEINAGAIRYADSDEVARGFAKGAAAWLSDERWTDQPCQPQSAINGKRTYADSLKIAAETAINHGRNQESLRDENPF